MATLLQYKCKCGYEVMASEKPDGHDYLMTSDLYHFMCKNCREIIDIYTDHNEEPQSPVCPNCASEDLERWNAITGKCPKCGGKLKFNIRTGMVLNAD